MLDVVTHWRDVIAKVKQAYPHVAPASYKFKHLIAAEVEASKLPGVVSIKSHTFLE